MKADPSPLKRKLRILYISYFYPPLGGPAVLRNTKTIKYLAQLGAEIHVITIDDIEYAYQDNSLMDECKESVLIRTPSLDPMALLKKLFKNKEQQSQTIYKNTPEYLKLLVRRLYPVDDKIGWLPYLYQAGIKALAQTEYDLIYVSCGPFSSAIAAYMLAKKSGLPLVVDYRDYWTLLSDYDLMGSRIKLAISRHWEKKILNYASLLVTATKGIGRDLCAEFGEQLEQKIFTLYNGHDEEDYRDLPEIKPSFNYFTLGYFGNIYARRSLKNLYAAVEELDREKLLPSNFRIQLVGNFNREVLEEIEHSGIKEMIQILPQMGHRKAIEAMLRTDALILIINSSSPYGTLTSKIFEYLRLARPILAMVPRNKEAAELLMECGVETICPMESVGSIKQCLIKLVDDRGNAVQRSTALEAYERGKQDRKSVV